MLGGMLSFLGGFIALFMLMGMATAHDHGKTALKEHRRITKFLAAIADLDDNTATTLADEFLRERIEFVNEHIKYDAKWNDTFLDWWCNDELATMEPIE
jgi:hypothetical protein